MDRRHWEPPHDIAISLRQIAKQSVLKARKMTRRVKPTLSPSTVDWGMAGCNLPRSLRLPGDPGLSWQKTPAQRFYFAYRSDQGHLVGPLFYRHGSFTIAVHPDYRRRGIGRMLLQEAMARIPELDLAAQTYTPAGAALVNAVIAA